MLNTILRVSIASATFLAAMTVMFSAAKADTCWETDGSLVRLTKSGSHRYFVFEIPAEELRRSGVSEGEMLFKARFDGKRYIGTVSQFAENCATPVDRFYADGFGNRGANRITIRGSSEVYNQCNPTGRLADREITFDYVRDC